MIIQKAQFSTGGFALHKVGTLSGNGKASAWFDANGGLINAELFDSIGRAYSIKEHSPLWNHLQRIGKIWA